MTSAVADALVRHGHVAKSMNDLNLPPEMSSGDVLKAAAQAQLDIVTTNDALVVAPFEQGVAFPRSIVYLQLEGGDVEQDDAIDRLFKRYKRLTPGRLYTVTATRVKIRQLPGKK
jgi:hypothetical protein